MMAQLVIYECVAHTFRHTHTRRHLQLQYINIEVLAVYQSVRRHKSTLNSKQQTANGTITQRGVSGRPQSIWGSLGPLNKGRSH